MKDQDRKVIEREQEKFRAKRAGQAQAVPCDACGRPVPADWLTDGVCDSCHEGGAEAINSERGYCKRCVGFSTREPGDFCQDCGAALRSTIGHCDRCGCMVDTIIDFLTMGMCRLCADG